jgi:hypothetical protein
MIMSLPDTIAEYLQRKIKVLEVIEGRSVTHYKKSAAIPASHTHSQHSARSAKITSFKHYWTRIGCQPKE